MALGCLVAAGGAACAVDALFAASALLQASVYIYLSSCVLHWVSSASLTFSAGANIALLQEFVVPGVEVIR